MLRALLRRLWDARRAEPTRLPLASALLEYLQLSRGPRLLRLPPPVLQAVLQGIAAAYTACCMELHAEVVVGTDMTRWMSEGRTGRPDVVTKA